MRIREMQHLIEEINSARHGKRGQPRTWRATMHRGNSCLEDRDVQQRTLAEEPPFEEETCRFGRVELSKDLVKAITQRHGVH